MLHRALSRRTRQNLPSGGFTLIELLIVIAIILILIAIALPNFLEAQIRARVTKTKGEIRSLGIAMESYFLDFTVYPSESEEFCPERGQGRFECGLSWLTTPIAYIGSIPTDPFPGKDQDDVVWYEMGGVSSGQTAGNPRLRGAQVTWAIFSRGPDLSENEIDSCCVNYSERNGSADNYSPTNGTKSDGDIFLYGGDSFWIGVNTGTAVKRDPLPIDPLVVDSIPYVHRLPIDSI